jgi:hypothetical protein
VKTPLVIATTVAVGFNMRPRVTKLPASSVLAIKAAHRFMLHPVNAGLGGVIHAPRGRR